MNAPYQQTGRQTDRQKSDRADCQPDSQPASQTASQTDRQIDRQTTVTVTNTFVRKGTPENRSDVNKLPFVAITILCVPKQGRAVPF